MHSLTEYVGRWSIRAAARPPLWPFLCDALIDIRPAATTGQAFLSVRTAGGALLRSYTLAWQPTDAGIVLFGLEYNGCAYALALAPSCATDGRFALCASWTSAGTPATAVGGWEAERRALALEPAAA